MSWAFVLPDGEIAPEVLPGLAADLEAAGYAGLWVGEVSGTDVGTNLMMIGTGTKSVPLGTSIIPIGTRGPAVLAMTLGALARTFPGRVRFGLGVSSEMIVTGWNARPYDRLVARMRDTLDFLRKALAGERIDEAFATFAVRGFRLTAVPAEPPPLLVAAAGPQMLELAKREADGVILNWCSAEDIATWEGLPDDRSRVAVMVAVCPVEDPEEARRIARPLVVQYLSVPGYADQQRRLGRGRALEPMWQAWAARERKKALELLPDEVIDQLVIHGSPATCRERLRDFARRSGALPLAHVVPGGPPVTEAARALGPAVDASND